MAELKRELRDYLERRALRTGRTVAALLRLVGMYAELEAKASNRTEELLFRSRTNEGRDLAVREAEQGLRALRLLGLYVDDTDQEGDLG